jgi:actin related protein 2/3 complex subunit 4
MEEVDREISEMKLSLNARARIVAESYLTAVSILSTQPLLQVQLTHPHFPSVQLIIKQHYVSARTKRI